MRPVEFWVAGEPQPNPKTSGSHRVWEGNPQDKHGRKKAWRDHVRMTADKLMRRRETALWPADVALRLDVVIHRRRTRTYRKNDKAPYGKPDAENYLCLIANALQGIVYTDDAQLVSVACRKTFASANDDDNMGAWIRVSEDEY
jgi:Holliday junction resolvase RusA-like endonuclease